MSALRLSTLLVDETVLTIAYRRPGEPARETTTYPTIHIIIKGEGEGKGEGGGEGERKGEGG